MHAVRFYDKTIFKALGAYQNPNFCQTPFFYRPLGILVAYRVSKTRLGNFVIVLCCCNDIINIKCSLDLYYLLLLPFHCSVLFTMHVFGIPFMRLLPIAFLFSVCRFVTVMQYMKQKKNKIYEICELL